MAANQNVTQLTQQTVSANTTSLFYAVTNGTTDTGLPLSVFVNNLGLTGVPTAPTAGSLINTTQIATGAYVASFYAPLASPTFTGTPTLPTGTIAVTQTAGNNSTAVATTAFVVASFAPLASPTLTGTPLAPTATTGTSTTQLATTAFVGNSFAAPPAYGTTTPAAVHATTISASGLISPTSTVGIAGTTAADNAQAGSVGEFISSIVVAGSAVALTSGTPVNITSISLTAGDWEVQGDAYFTGGASTVGVYRAASVSQTTGTLDLNVPNYNIAPDYASTPFGTTTGNASGLGVLTPMIRKSFASTTTIFLVVQAGFSVSTESAYGMLRARRVR
jgi:hypothetical protein